MAKKVGLTSALAIRDSAGKKAEKIAVPMNVAVAGAGSPPGMFITSSNPDLREETIRKGKNNESPLLARKERRSD
jgi:hypothetical protein